MKQFNTAQQMEVVIRDLHEEALQSIRQRSSIAAEEVATAYVELWLSWAKAWSKYGQTLKGGILRNFDPLRLGYTSGLGRNLYGGIQQAVDAGLRDHVSAFRGVLLRVTSQAITLKAPDLVDEMLEIARSFLTFSSDHRPDLAASVQDRGWRFQIEMCRFYMEPAFDTATQVPDIELSFLYIHSCFRSLLKSLRVLYNNQSLSQMKEVDVAFCNLLRFPPRSDNVFRATNILQDVDSHGEEAVDQAAATLERIERRQSLEDIRRAGRLAILGWLLQQYKDSSLLSQDESELLKHFAGSLGSLAEVIHAVETALRVENHDPFDWIPPNQAEAEILRIDEAILSAVVFTLLYSSSPIPESVEPARWITDTRLNLLGDIIDGWVSSNLWEQLDTGATRDFRSRAKAIRKSFQIAQRKQANTERDSLIKACLDPSKVQEFRDAAVTGWQTQRRLEAYATYSGLRIKIRSQEDFADSRLGIYPRPLLPKGLFVTPTNWIGLDTTGRDYGNAIARGEIGRLIHHLQEESVLVSSTGTASERIAHLRSLMQMEGRDPSLVLLPYNWRVAQDLKLDMWQERDDSSKMEYPFIGTIENVPVSWHSELSNDRMYLADLRQFCHVEETTIGKGHGGEGYMPRPPEVDITLMTEKRAYELAERSQEAIDNPEQLQEKQLEMLTHVVLDIYRPYRIVLGDRKAVLSTQIPAELCEDQP